MKFSKRLASLRKERGLIQKTLAEQVGVHITQIQRYEAGSIQPTLDVLRRLAVALSVSADLLVFDKDERGPDADLKLEFEALSQFHPEEQAIAKKVEEDSRKAGGLVVTAMMGVTPAKPGGDTPEGDPDGAGHVDTDTDTGTGTGTDTGGSVRVPAGMCGIVGLKVTHGRVPLTGVFPLAPSLDTVGPLGRSVEDVALLYAALAGHDPDDPWSAPRPPPMPDEAPADLSGIRVGLPQPWIADAPATPNVTTAFATAVDRISDAGAAVTELRAPVLVPSRHGGSIIGAEAAKVHRPWFGSRPYGPAVAERLRGAFDVTIDQYIDALEWTAKLRNATAAIFGDVDLLLTPTVAATRKLIGEPTIDGVPYRRVLSWFSSPVNHMGVPALSVPLHTPGTPPPSLQLVAPWWAENRLLAVGRALENLGIATFSPPPVP